MTAVVRLVVVLGLCHVALATATAGWHMTGGDASRSYSGPAGARSPLWAHPYVKAGGQDALYGLGRAGLSSPQHIVGPTGVLYYPRDSRTVVAFAMHSNSTIWELRLGTHLPAEMGLKSNLALSDDGARLYGFATATDGSSSVLCVNSTDGVLLWASIPTSCVGPTESPGHNATFPLVFTDSPVVHPITRSVIAVGACGQLQVILYSLQGSFTPDRGQAKTLPLAQLAEWNRTIALVSSSDGLVLFTQVEPALEKELSPYMMNHSLVALHPTNGSQAWSSRIARPALPRVSTVTRGGIVVITSFLPPQPPSSPEPFETLLYSIPEGRMVNDRLGHLSLRNTAVAAIGVDDDSLYAVVRDEESRNDTEPNAQLLRIATTDAEFGRLVWRWDDNGTWSVGSALAPRLSVDGADVVYVYIAGQLHGIHAGTGQTLWRWHADEPMRLRSGGTVPSFAPIIATSPQGKTRLVVELAVDGPLAGSFSRFGVLDCCSGNGECVYDQNRRSSRCECRPNYIRPDCSVFCDAQACALRGPHFACLEQSGECGCAANWFPEGNCTVFCNVSQCAQRGPHHVCSIHGCECEQHFYGTDCSVRCDAAADCNGHGECGRDGKCVCRDDGWLALYAYSEPDCDKKVNVIFIVFVCGLALGSIVLVVLIIGVCTYWRMRQQGTHIVGDSVHERQTTMEYEYSIVFEMDQHQE